MQSFFRLLLFEFLDAGEKDFFNFLNFLLRMWLSKWGNYGWALQSSSSKFEVKLYLKVDVCNIIYTCGNRNY
jgi:hypothetical protein